MMLLLTIHRRNGVSIPANPRELPPAALDHVPLSRLIDDGLVTLTANGDHSVMRLTPVGLSYLRGLVIDYHLELMDRRAASNEFFSDLVEKLKRAGCRRIALYGASDTAKVLLDFLKSSPIEAVAVLDDDPIKQGDTFSGVPIVAPSKLSLFDYDSVVVTTVLFQDKILKEKASAVPPGKRVIGLFDSLLS
ncbi:MAG: hypothetical protein K2Y23_17505 [Cyanobacteria bacterium]|nr:hypothetical protein [Cyanobacteriota bacterium]